MTTIASVMESRCRCGEPMLIEHGVPGFRADGKRVYYPGEPHTVCAFRCRSCHEPVHESVPGAEFGERVYGEEVPSDE